MAEVIEKVEAKTKRGGKREGSGRKKGTPNKLTSSFREAVLIAFEGIGGHKGFTDWARKQKTEYYKIAARLIPAEIQQLGKDGQPVDPVAAPSISVTVGALPEPKKGNGHG